MNSRADFFQLNKLHNKIEQVSLIGIWLFHNILRNGIPNWFSCVWNLLFAISWQIFWFNHMTVLPNLLKFVHLPHVLHLDLCNSNPSYTKWISVNVRTHWVSIGLWHDKVTAFWHIASTIPIAPIRFQFLWEQSCELVFRFRCA